MNRERLFFRKVVPYRPQPEGVCFAKQSLFQLSFAETKSHFPLVTPFIFCYTLADIWAG